MRHQLISFYLFTLCLVGCLPTDEGYFFQIKNNSNTNNYVYADYIYPDTILPEEKPDLIEIEVSSKASITDRYLNDEDLKRLKSEKLTIFFFNTDTVEKYNWNLIKDEYKVIERRNITYEELEGVNFELIYP